MHLAPFVALGFAVLIQLFDLRPAVSAIVVYYHALWHILVVRGPYDELRRLTGAPRIPFWSKCEERTLTMTEVEEEALYSAVWLHAISLTIHLWDQPHYRCSSLRDDLVENLRNVAVPGLGVPLSWVCTCRLTAVLYLLFLHPWLVLGASWVICLCGPGSREQSFGSIFREELLAPKHWFAIWRINSALAAGHHMAHLDRPKIRGEYKYENKWDFLELALKQSLLPSSQVKFRVAPILSHVKEVVVKHKKVEGGMGIHMYHNALDGGDWILQERLFNCPELEVLLPPNAPLSTLRVVTVADPTAENFDSSHSVLIVVWRAGRAGKFTDHSSVLFSVNPETGVVQEGKVFSNWYQVGKFGFGNLLSKEKVLTHPDTNELITGKELSFVAEAIDMCVDAHRRLMPSVPTIGWDVALAKQYGPVLLEANLSCNFFGGSFDHQRYLRIVDTYFANGCRPGPSCYANRDEVGSSTYLPGMSELGTVCTDNTDD